LFEGNYPLMKLRTSLAATIFVVALVTSNSNAQHVSAHKASILDVPARIAQLQTTKDPLLLSAIKGVRSCLKTDPVVAPASPMRIPHHYLNGSHGPTNPAEAAATVMYGKFEQRITAGMNQYVATGSDAEAKCALDQMDAWAKANALTAYDPHDKDNTQSWYQAEWTLCSAGVTFSVLVNNANLDLPELKRVALWLDTAAHQLISYEKPGELGNNHHYWRALAAISIGVACSDDVLFKYGVEVYKQAIAQLDKNGAFPLEMERHERATHYQAFALQPLVLIAAFAARQNVDLYGYSSNGHTLYDAIVFLGKAIDDPSIIKQYTPDKQMADYGGGDYAPFAYFAARFPNQVLPPSITNGLKHPTGETRIGGSATLLATP
jgi:poly(beta-D-mannuronate) lyase